MKLTEIEKKWQKKWEETGLYKADVMYKDGLRSLVDVDDVGLALTLNNSYYAYNFNPYAGNLGITLFKGDGFYDEADKAPVRDAIEKLKNTVKSDDLDAIKADTEALEKAFYPIAEKMYAQTQGDAGQGAGFDPNMGAQGGDGTYYSADFEDKSDN